MITFNEFKKNCTTSFFDSFSRLSSPVVIKDLADKTELLETIKLNQNSNLKDKLMEKDILLLEEALIGEKKVLEVLKKSKYPMSILHDIRLEIDEEVIQFDFIIITPNAIYPIACKHLLGELEINKNMDFIRVIKNSSGKIIKRQSINNPVNSLYKNTQSLENYLKKNDLDFNYPVKSFVVFTDKESFISKDCSKKKVSKFVCSIKEIINYIECLDKEYLALNKNILKSISNQYKIAEVLCSNNISLN